MHSYSALPGAFFFTLVLLLTIAFVTLVSKWKVYAKLGMPGWYSLVPIYSDRKLYEHVRGNEENKTLRSSAGRGTACAHGRRRGSTPQG